MCHRLTLFVFGVVLSVFSSLLMAQKLELTIVSASGLPKGTITIALNTTVAPLHVARITQLTEEGFYDGVVFHRVIEGFMAQTGDGQFGKHGKIDSRRVGTGRSSDKNLKAELSDIPFTKGVMGMARGRYINSANSQFFIMTESAPSLDGQYTVVGEVVAGLNVVNLLRKGRREQNGSVKQPDLIKTARIIP